MKTAKLIARIVLSPLIFVIVFVFTLIVAVNNLILFARYGGEFINYSKDDSKHIYDIYELLKKEYADRKVIDETIPDFPDCRMCLFFDNVDYDVICDDCIESNKFKNKDTTDSSYKWNDIIKDPDNKGKTITEKEYLLRRGIDVNKIIEKKIT